MTPTKTPSSRPAAGKPAAGPDGAEPGEGPRSRLSKATVVEQALAVGDAEGLDGLTIRRLAQELGVTRWRCTGTSAARKSCSAA